MNNILVFVTENGQIGKLATLLKLDTASFDALVVGDRTLAEEAATVSASVKWVDTQGKLAEDYAAAVAQIIEPLSPKAVVAVSTPGSRAALGKLACAWEAPTISNAISVEVNGETVCVDHMVLQDKVIETIQMPSPAVTLADPLALKADETAKGPAATIEQVTAESAGLVEVVSVEPAEDSALQDAEIVVSVGRGIAGGNAFDMAKKLCETLGGEMGCSMPAASELGLLPRECYVGMSGKRIEPKLYVALGISGLTHHIMGVKNARAIVVVNKDPKAFFFENSDYGIVGDVEEIIPELERAFKAVL